MTPDQLKLIFDQNAVLLMFLVGIAIKYVPALAKVSNDAIGWINLLLYVLTKLFVGTAHAGILNSVPDAVGVLLGGLTSAGWAHVIYEAVGRTLLEKWLHLKKAEPQAAKAAA